MNNFGVIEVAGPKTAATPGWAYVADAAPIQHASSTGRKRAAARGQGLSLTDQSAREEAKIRKELEGLDRESSRDVVIPVPAKGRGEHFPLLVLDKTRHGSWPCTFDGRLALTGRVRNQCRGNTHRTLERFSRATRPSRTTSMTSRPCGPSRRTTPPPTSSPHGSPRPSRPTPHAGNNLPPGPHPRRRGPRRGRKRKGRALHQMRRPFLLR